MVRGSAAGVAERFGEPPKGEITIVIGPTTRADVVAAADAERAMVELVDAGLPRRQAADVVARLTGLPKNRLYRGSL